jgi:RNA polymerase sigma-70 factor, ECF subfamily
MQTSSSSSSYPSFAAPPSGSSASAGTGGVPERLLLVPENEQAAFDTAFRQHRDRLLAYLYTRLGCQEDAEDALVVTFHHAWRARDTFRGEASDKTWLYRIATRVALDLLRRRGRHARHTVSTGETLLGESWSAEAADPAEALLSSEGAAETRRAVRQAMGRLSPEEQRLLQLYYFDGYKYEEISSLLGIPYTKVRGRLHRIRHLIRRDLRERQQWQPS